MTLAAGGGGGVASSFALAAANSDPHGIAYSHGGYGSLYVGDASEIVYRYDLGGRLLNTYNTVPNPLPIEGTRPRGTVRSLTRAGDFMAVVYHARQELSGTTNYNDNTGIAWLPLDTKGAWSGIGARTSTLEVIQQRSVTEGADTAAAPVQRGESAASQAFIIDRGPHEVHVFDLGSDIPADVDGARDALKGLNNLEPHGLAPWTGTVGNGGAFLMTVANQAGFLRRGLPGGDGGNVNAQAGLPPLLTAEHTVALAALVRGMTSDPSTRRIWTVGSDNRVRMFAA